MMAQVLQQSRRVIQTGLRRNFGVSAVVCQKATDPIQALFLDKVRDYAKKSKTAGGKLVDATPELEKSLQNDLEKLDRQFGATGPDFLKFPTFNFTDSKLQPVGVSVEAKAAGASGEAAAAAEEANMDELNRPCWQV